VHISSDNGYTWNDVSAGLPKNLWVSRVQLSSHEKNRVYVTLNGYRNDHFLPYIFVSEDLGKTWRSISSNLPTECVNVLREDSKHPNLLYIGTDHGLYVSTNQGVTWHVLSDLPAVAVHDLIVQESEEDLIIGTHGRSIWITELEPLREYMEKQNDTIVLFSIPAIRWSADWGGNWSKWLEPQIPEQSIAIYAPTTATCDVKILYSDSLQIQSLGEIKLHEGYNRISYDLSVPADRVNMIQEWVNKGKEVGEITSIKKADNGIYYLPKGDYTIVISGSFGTKRSSFRME
jgi:hypothetical protein